MTTGDRPLRRDAQRNRELVIAAAREVFGSKGLDAPLDEVARRAGVAIGTLYNRFPTRDALVEAAFLDLVERSVEVAENALRAEDPWEGFVRFLEHTCELLAADRGYADVCARDFSGAPAIEDAKRRAGGLMVEIVTRAKESGRLRPDFDPADLGFALAGVARTAELTADVAPRAWRRHLGYLLDGFHAEAAHPLPAPPLSAAELTKAMRSR